MRQANSVVDAADSTAKLALGGFFFFFKKKPSYSVVLDAVVFTIPKVPS